MKRSLCLKGELVLLVGSNRSKPLRLLLAATTICVGRQFAGAGDNFKDKFLIIGHLLTAVAALAAQPAQQGVMMLAQAHDRCMTTYAVRLTRTPATDEAIYAEAVAGCKALNDQLSLGIAREYPAAQAAELNAMLEAQAKPNFLALLQRIRADRLTRANK